VSGGPHSAAAGYFRFSSFSIACSSSCLPWPISGRNREDPMAQAVDFHGLLKGWSIREKVLVADEELGLPPHRGNFIRIQHPPVVHHLGLPAVVLHEEPEMFHHCFVAQERIGVPSGHLPGDLHGVLAGREEPFRHEHLHHVHQLPKLARAAVVRGNRSCHPYDPFHSVGERGEQKLHVVASIGDACGIRLSDVQGCQDVPVPP
jgi:hypothetical protein